MQTLPPPDTLVGAVPEVLPGVWTPIPPNKMPRRLVGRKHPYEPYTCNVCGLLGHNSSKHLELETKSRTVFLFFHIRGVLDAKPFLSDHELWHQLNIYPRMIVGYADQIANDQPVYQNEVDAVLDAFQILCPSRVISTFAPMVDPLNRDHRGLKRVLENALAYPLKGTNNKKGSIDVLNPHIFYTARYIADEIEHRPNYELNYAPVSYGNCTLCGLVGHNAQTCRGLHDPDKLVRNTASACAKTMGGGNVLRTLNNSLMLLVKIAMAMKPGQRWDVSIERMKPRTMGFNDLVAAHNSMVAHAFPSSTRFVALRDVKAVFHPLHPQDGRIAAEFRVRQSQRPIVKILPAPWIIEGRVYRFKDQAIGTVALLQAHTVEARRRIQAIDSVTSEFYSRLEDDGNMDVVERFNIAIGAVLDVQVSLEEWENAQQLIEASHAIDLMESHNSKKVRRST